MVPIVGHKYIWKQNNHHTNQINRDTFTVKGYSKRFVYYRYDYHWGSKNVQTSRSYFNINADVDRDWLWNKQLKELLDE